MVFDEIEELKKIDLLINKKNNDNIENFIDDSITVIPEDSNKDSFLEGMQEITKELTNDKNVFRFSNNNKLIVFHDSMLATISSVPYFDKKIRPRYEFLKYFRYNYHVGLSAIKSSQADRYKDIAGSLLAFRGMLEYRKAGVNDMNNMENNFSEKIKKGK